MWKKIYSVNDSKRRKRRIELSLEGQNFNLVNDYFKKGHFSKSMF